MSIGVYNTIIALQVIGIIMLFVETIYLLFQSPSKVRSELILMTLSTLLTMIGYLMEVQAESLDAALIGTTVSYIGKPFAILSSGLFIASYCGYKPNRYVVLVLALIAAAFPIIIYTNALGLNNLYYATMDIDLNNGQFSPLILTHGPIYYLYMVYLFGFMIFEFIITIHEIRRCKSKTEKIQIVYIFAMLFVTILGFVIYLTGITKGYDSTMAGCFAAIILLSVLFTKYRLLDVVSVAKEEALSDATGGILVVDQRGRLAYSNTVIERLMQNEAINVAELKGLENDSIIKDGDNIYKVNKHDIYAKDRFLGTVVETADITASYNYAERLEKDVKTRTDEITHIQRSIIGGFANIVEERNGETGSHIKRTGAYVKLLATQLQKVEKYSDILTDEYISRLQDAAPLHDIGKVVVPDQILMKPGRLTKEEFEIMKEHSKAGADIVEKTMRGIESNEYVSTAEEMAYFHHEKWDGSGYPSGLMGEDIPLSARIMAVADVYDALRSERCYKEAFDKDKSRKIIVEDSGRHFDPTVVSAFLGCIDEIENVK